VSALHRFVSFAFAGADALVEVASDGRVAFAAGATETLFGSAEQDMAGRTAAHLICEHDRPVAARMLSGLSLGSRAGPMLVTLANDRKALLSACRMPGTPDVLSCTFAAASPALVRQAASRRRDAATSLLEEAGFRDAAGEALELDPEGTSVSLIRLAGLGAGAGDALVGRIAETLRAVSIDGDSAARLGKDRFGVLHRRNADIAGAIAEARKEALEEGIEIEADVSTLAGAGGLSREDAAKAVRFAIGRFSRGETAQSGDLAAAFDALVEDAVRRLMDFQAAVRAGSFDLAYQPIVGLKDRKVHHFEVLCRFKDQANPFAQIQFAEEIGVIQRFDLAVMSRAIDAMRSHPGGPHGPLSLAVNISGKSMQDRGFAAMLKEMLKNAKDLEGRLLIELTESSEVTEIEAASNLVEALRTSGFPVCIDDFGAGAASYRYVQAFSADWVKIDGQYVKRIGAGPKDDAVVKSMVELCTGLGMGVVAEFVETQEQADRLVAMGVELGQGWLFGKASPTPTWPEPEREGAASAADPVSGKEAAASTHPTSAPSQGEGSYRPSPKSKSWDFQPRGRAII
jgi:EAL domain-containing protein (putative c-di-GMP-specific phosphodiesterase class I)